MSSPRGHVLHFVPWAEVGGTERMVENLCVAGEGFKHTILFAEKGPAIDQCIQRQIPVLTYPTSRNILDSTFSADTVSVLHAHIMEIPHIPKALSLARSLSLPGLFTLHGRRILPPLPWTLVCVSDSIAESQTKNKLNRIVIPNGVPLSPMRAIRRSSGITVVTMISRERRVAPFATACVERLCSLNPNIRVWIVGQSGRSTEQITYFGVQDSVQSLLDNTDIFIYPVLPGAHDLTVLEAMSRGLPCICTAVPGVIESITHLHDGILVSGDDGAAFLEAIMMLVQSTPLQAYLAANARHTVESRFSIDLCWSKYRALYVKTGCLVDGALTLT